MASEEKQFCKFWEDAAKKNWGLWGNPISWPELNGIGYKANQYETKKDGRNVTATIIEFNEPVTINGKTSRRFGIGSWHQLRSKEIIALPWSGRME
jgi:hypothetical protein